MKIVTVVGARPQFIKASAMSRVLRKEHEEILIHTGQHYDENMSEVFFTELNIPKPNYNLGIAGGSHAKMTGDMLIELEKIIIVEKPDAVLIYGDTNSTLSAALAAVKVLIPVIHVEAGNRLGTLTNPEEVNRILVDHVSELLFCPTEIAYENLKKEGLEQKAYVVGNIMYDAYLNIVDRLDCIESELKDLSGRAFEMPDKYYYLTCHRQENTYTDEPLIQILQAMNRLDATTIYPVHPRNQERAKRICEKFDLRNIKLLSPTKYSDSIRLTQHAIKIVTDSGGLQCEAFYAEKQCVTVFDYAGWPETLVGNRNQLAKPDAEDILSKLHNEQTIDRLYQPFGNGASAEKMMEIINRKYGR